MGPPERDEELVRRFLLGDADAFERLVERHRQRVYNLCLRILGDPEDAADAAQDTFLSVLTKLTQFRGDAAFTTWMHRVTVNACHDLSRKRRRQPLLRFAGDQDLPEAELGPPVPANGCLSQFGLWSHAISVLLRARVVWPCSV